jgi:hypothetical protein
MSMLTVCSNTMTLQLVKVEVPASDISVITPVYLAYWKGLVIYVNPYL